MNDCRVLRAMCCMPGFQWKHKFVRPLIHGEHVALLLFLEQLHGFWRKAAASCAQPDAFACGYGNVSIAQKILPAPLPASMDGSKHGMVAEHKGPLRQLRSQRPYSEKCSVPTVKHILACDAISNSRNLERHGGKPLLRRSCEGGIPP